MIPADLHLLIRDVRQLQDNECSFLLGSLTTRVCIRVHVGDGGWWHWEQSHFIHTPLQMGPYQTSLPGHDTEERVWRAVIDTLTRWYVEALQAGHQPEESWLVPNPDFDFDLSA